MVGLTPGAITKVKEILSQQTPLPTGLRIAVVGGGCSGFSYHMAFENQVNENSDNVYEFEGLKVLVDQMSEMYLDGVQVDYMNRLTVRALSSITRTSRAPAAAAVLSAPRFRSPEPRGQSQGRSCGSSCAPGVPSLRELFFCPFCFWDRC